MQDKVKRTLVLQRPIQVQLKYIQNQLITVCPHYNAPRYNADLNNITVGIGPEILATTSTSG